LIVAGTLSREAGDPSCSCSTPASISIQPGVDRVAGVETLGRYGTAAGSSSAASAVAGASARNVVAVSAAPKVRFIEASSPVATGRP